MAKYPKCQIAGKTRYPTPGDALNAIVQLRSQPRHYDYMTGKRCNRRQGKVEQCRYYSCRACQGYHLTKWESYTSKRYDKDYMDGAKRSRGLVVRTTEKVVENWKKDSLPFPEDLIIDKQNNNENII